MQITITCDSLEELIAIATALATLKHPSPSLSLSPSPSPSLPLPPFPGSLSKRIANTLVAEGVRSWEQLAALTAVDLLKMPNLGRGSLAEIQEALKSYGLS